MTKRLTGVALVLAMALTSFGFAQEPHDPTDCIFERGTTTCTEVGETFQLSREYYETHILIDEPSCLGPIWGEVWKVTYRTTTTVTTFFGVSHVEKDDPLVTNDDALKWEYLHWCSYP